MKLKVIAYARNGFSQKFGIPRQSREDSCIETHIIFAPAYCVREALRGIEDYSHLWLLWGFHETIRQKGNEAQCGELDWSPTVRPPRLGGNKRMGVFATRSPFRPNSIGLSCLKLDKIEYDKELGAVLYVSGCDMMNGTPIYDIKPYLPYCDSRPDAAGGFTETLAERKLEVVISDDLLTRIPTDKQSELLMVLHGDPRPSYQNDPNRVYGFAFSDYEVAFKVEEKTLTVTKIEKN